MRIYLWASENPIRADRETACWSYTTTTPAQNVICCNKCRSVWFLHRCAWWKLRAIKDILKDASFICLKHMQRTYKTHCKAILRNETILRFAPQVFFFFFDTPRIVTGLPTVSKKPTYHRKATLLNVWIYSESCKSTETYPSLRKCRVFSRFYSPSMCDSRLRMAPSSDTLRKEHLPKAAVPEMLARFGNSSDSSVISIPQLRRCATCPSEQRRNPKSSSQRKRQTLRFTYMRTSEKNISSAYVCVSAISFTLKYHPLGWKVWRDLRKSAPLDARQGAQLGRKPSEGCKHLSYVL